MLNYQKVNNPLQRRTNRGRHVGQKSIDAVAARLLGKNSNPEATGHVILILNSILDTQR